MTKRAKDENSWKLDYLLKKYSVSYTPSATLLNRKSDNKTSLSQLSCLALAPDYKKDGLAEDVSEYDSRPTGVRPILGAQEELKMIKQYVKGKFLTGNNASEEQFKLQAGKYNILHLAAHGIADHQNPSRSHIIFSSNTDTLDDDTLFAYEVYNLALNAEMVVLSACQTASGKLILGEGLMSLARAFRFAGCQSIVSSLWNADDKSTAAIMNNYYKELNSGQDREVALQKAKLDFLNEADALKSHPAFWAAFVLIGDAKPLVIDKYSFDWVFWVVFGLGVLALILIYWSYRGASRIQ